VLLADRVAFLDPRETHLDRPRPAGAAETVGDAAAELPLRDPLLLAGELERLRADRAGLCRRNASIRRLLREYTHSGLLSCIVPSIVSHNSVPPLLRIEIEIESAPRIRVFSGNESEQNRLMDWVLSRDEYAALLWQALELAEQQPAA